MIKQLLITLFGLQVWMATAQPISRIFTFPENNGELTVQEISTGKNGAWFAAGSGVGEYQIFVTKFNADNEVEWSHIYDDRRGINFIYQLPGNGNTLVFNNNQSFAEYFDASILELDEDGLFASETIWGTEGGAEGWSDFVSLPGGKLIILGSGFDGDTGEDFNSLYAMDSLGNISLEQYFAFNDGVGLGTLIPDANDGFYAIGGTFQNETAIAHYNSAAELLWAKKYQWATNQINLYDGTLLADGSLFLYGGSDFTNTNISSDFFGCKLSAEGEIISNFYLNTEDGVNPEQAFLIGGDTVLIATTSNNQYWPLVDNDNLSILLNASTGEVYNSYAFGSPTRDYPFEVTRMGNQLVWGGMTNQYTTIDSTLGYIAFSPINGTGACSKNYAVSKGELVNLEPLVTELDYTVRPGVSAAAYETSQTSITFTLSGSCSGINSIFDNTNYCAVSTQNFDQTLRQVSELAEGEIRLTITDLSGRQLIQTATSVSTTAAQLADQLPVGWYVYSLSFKGCGGAQQATGKLPVVR
jgi:hypothetical protein